MARVTVPVGLGDGDQVVIAGESWRGGGVCMNGLLDRCRPAKERQRAYRLRPVKMVRQIESPKRV